jgi:hypothetical protein
MSLLASDHLAGLPISVHSDPLLLGVIDVKHIRTLEQFYRNIIDRCGHRFARVVSLLAADNGVGLSSTPQRARTGPAWCSRSCCPPSEQAMTRSLPTTR